jgi:FdhD protein
MDERQPGALPYTYMTVNNGRTEIVEGGVVEEARLTIYVNGQELAALMCSPVDQEVLALGFLFNEGVIHSLEEIRLIQANAARTTVDIFLNRSEFDPPRRMVLTSGCGGGVTFQDLQHTHPALETDFHTEPETLHRLMRELKGAARLYNSVRGVHTAVLGDSGGLLIATEDVGRHNTIDKIAGKALVEGIRTRDRILVTTGRISSEMLNKARMLGVPVVASHTSPTSLTLGLAAAWNICVAGYVRQNSLRVYTHPYRLGLPATSGPLPAAADAPGMDAG